MHQVYRLFVLAALLCAAVRAAAQCPTFVACSAQTDTFCDLTPNDPLFWNHPTFVTPLTSISDLFEAPADLSVQAKTTCGNAAAISVRCLLYLDLDADGIQETVVDSGNLPPAGTVLKGNAANPNFTGGTSVAFDTRVVPENQKMRFFLEKMPAGDTLTARLRWNNELAPSNLQVPQLPAGQHRVVWLLQQPGGGTDTCSRTFRVIDCQAPTMSCRNGLSVNIMFTSQITLWASDFLQYTEDNTTPTNKLEIAIRRKGSGGSFPVDTLGNPVSYVTFTCTDIGVQNVELWSRDKSGNASFCETYAIVQDNGYNCGGPVRIPACAQHHCDNQPFEDVEMTLSVGGLPTGLHLPKQTNHEGCADLWQSVPFWAQTVVTPIKDENPLNGVSTYDLVLISKHILGLEPLPSPYHMIAADANRSGSITTFDIVELRKLILGIYTELPNNTSWRFVDKAFVFPDAANPFKIGFPESISIEISTLFTKAINFAAIKIGDVNCSAAANTFSGETTDRAALALTSPDRWLSAGETFDLPLSVEADGPWIGCQLGFAYDPQIIEIESVESNVLPGFDAQHWARAKPGRVNISWSGTQPTPALPGDAVLLLRGRALAPLRLRDALRLCDERLRSERYDADGLSQPLGLEFREQVLTQSDGAIIATPQPNPTSGGTTFRLQLEEAAEVQVTLSDLSGREIFRQEISRAAGEVWVEIPASAFPQTGVYMWRVVAGEAVQTGKVVRL